MIEYQHVQDAIDDAALAQLSQVVRLCFGEDPGADFPDRVREKRGLLLILASHSNEPVGFKLGYQRTRGALYSWLGGVVPDFRRRGIAREMARLQQEWCRRAGYVTVDTEALNVNPAMIKLNLDAGFVIIGTRLDDRGLKIQLTCRL